MTCEIDFLWKDEGLISCHIKTKKFIFNAKLLPLPDLWHFGINDYWKNSNVTEFGFGPVFHFSYIRL
jgi:hypothetical protein